MRLCKSVILQTFIFAFNSNTNMYWNLKTKLTETRKGYSNVELFISLVPGYYALGMISIWHLLVITGQSGKSHLP